MRIIAIFVFLFVIPGLAAASDYSTFTKDIVEPYGYYKKSIALTSKKKNQDQAIATTQKFVKAWQTFADKYVNDAPEPFSNMKDFDKKISSPTKIGEEALKMLMAGEVLDSHKHLEQVRYLLWRMRVDAGISSLNDKTNDFHEAMEIVLEGIKLDDSAQHLKHLGNRYGEWLAIKWADVGGADDSVADKDAFEQVIKNGHSAITKLVDALKEGDVDRAKKAGGKVKKGYKAIFFLPECS
jgi:hypothetical protein